jgi:hypothetical protein
MRLVFLLLFLFSSVVYAEELYSYKVSGHNVHTGLRVVGQAWEQDKNGNILAKVYDEFSILDHCYGSWVGYGVMQVGCENGYQYILEVVE